MNKTAKKIELLAPAGSLEKLRYAIEYGADAVYAGMPDVSMRAKVNTFTEKSLKEAVEYAHARKKKLYVTVNIYAHNFHLPKIEKHLKFLKKIKPDAVIVSDSGIIKLVKKHLPKTDIHLSTQANTTNWQAAKFWHDLGVKRIILAREVTLEDIKIIHRRVPKLELEYFVHGAMCMSYSGRCILSKWMSGRSANLGDCTQPCRWAYAQNDQFPISPPAEVWHWRAGNFQTNHNDSISKQNSEYKIMEVKEKQSGKIVELEEDQHGTYFFNSRDLNLIAHLEDLRNAGVSSFKIEGRNKSVYYVANVTRAYRKVLDNVGSKKELRWAENELGKLSNRGYTKGFLLGNEPEHNFEGNQSNEEFQFVGEVVESNGNELIAKIHNALRKEDKVEIIDKEKNIPIKIISICNNNKEEVLSAHGGHNNLYYVKINKKGIRPLSLLRKIK